VISKHFRKPQQTNMASKTRRASRSKASRKTQRKSTRKSGGASAWNKKVMEVYREMKRKDPKTRLGDAMREASRRSK
jgi:hypothetical protein